MVYMSPFERIVAQRALAAINKVCISQLVEEDGVTARLAINVEQAFSLRDFTLVNELCELIENLDLPAPSRLVRAPLAVTVRP